jgi:ankyrin repeat protein
MHSSRLLICMATACVVLFCFRTARAESLLADAAEEQNAGVVRALLAKNVDVNASQADGTTALHWAAHDDDVALTRELIAAGANPNLANRYGIRPITLACTNGSTATVELLLEAGADPNSSIPGGETALMTASRTGVPGAVEALLSHGADVNARERKRQTALMWAADEGNTDVVDTLLKSGADFRTPLRSGFTPFFFAVREGRLDTALKLIKAGADVNEIMRSQSGRETPPTTALILAVENGHFELAKALLDAGADPNAHPAGFAALHAVTWTRKPIRGDGDPPPIGSGQVSSLDIVRALAAKHADINVRLENGVSKRGRFTTTGSTPFLLAARASDVPLMKLLVKLGTDTTLSNADGCTPLLAAAGVGALENGEETAGTEDEAIEAVEMLIGLGVSVNAVDKNRETAMHGAAYQSRSKLIDVLARRGADVHIWNTKNAAGWTPLMIAQGHRPGNFRPDGSTIDALERQLRAHSGPAGNPMIESGAENTSPSK